MGVDHRLLKTSENFKGLDLRSSDIMRNQEFSTDMRNAAYRISGAINKRKGFVHKRNSNFIKGMTTFKNIGANGSIVDELIYVENNTIQKEVEFDMVGYRSSNVSTSPISLQLTRDAGTSTITATDAAGGSFFNKDYTSSDTIQDFFDDFYLRSDFLGENGTPAIDFENMSTLSVYGFQDLINDPGIEFDFNEDYGEFWLMIPVTYVNTAAIDSINGLPNGLEKFQLKKDLVQINGVKHTRVPNVQFYVNEDLTGGGSTTYSSGVHNYLRIHWTSGYLGDVYYGAGGESSWEYTPSTWTSASSWLFREYILFASYGTTPTGSGAAKKHTFSITNFNNAVQTGYNALDTFLSNSFPAFPTALSSGSTEIKFSSKTTSNIVLDLRNDSNQAVPQFKSQSIDRLNVFNTEISNNASSTFPTKVTIGSIQEQVGSNLTWTSSDYEDVLTENVNFAPLNTLLYISNGIDELLRGAKFTFSVNTSS